MIVNYVVSNIKTVEIWPLEEVKNYLRISHDYDDKLLANLTVTAINSAELFTGLSLHIKQVVCRANRAVKVIRLKYIPILDVKEICFIEKENKNDITDKFGYIQTDNLCIHFSDEYIGKNIEITYQAGYQNNIPRSIQHGILMHIAAMYENPENATAFSSQIKDLYLPYRVIKI